MFAVNVTFEFQQQDQPCQCYGLKTGESNPSLARLKSPLRHLENLPQTDASLLPVLLAGAGPLGLVDHLGHAGRHGSGRVSEAAVERRAAAHHAATVGRVPGVVAVGPRQQVGHGHEEVVEGDADDHVVIDADVGGHHHHAVAHTWRTFDGTTGYKT